MKKIINIFVIAAFLLSLTMPVMATATSSSATATAAAAPSDKDKAKAQAKKQKEKAKQQAKKEKEKAKKQKEKEKQQAAKQKQADKKRAEAEQAVRQDLGAKGYAYVTVDLSHSIDDKTEIAGTVSGSLHAYAKVTISIVDENGRPLTHKNKSGTVVKYRFGGAASEETVPMVADVYDGQALYDLYPSAIRAAIRNSLKD